MPRLSSALAGRGEDSDRAAPQQGQGDDAAFCGLEASQGSVPLAEAEKINGREEVGCPINGSKVRKKCPPIHMPRNGTPFR